MSHFRIINAKGRWEERRCKFGLVKPPATFQTKAFSHLLREYIYVHKVKCLTSLSPIKKWTLYLNTKKSQSIAFPEKAMHILSRSLMFHKVPNKDHRKSCLTFVHQWRFSAHQWHSFASIGIHSALKCIPNFLYMTPKKSPSSRAESSGRREHKAAVSCCQAPVPNEPALTDSFCCMIGNKFIFVKQNSTDCIKVKILPEVMLLLVI